MYFKNYDESFAHGLVHVGGSMSTLRTSTIELLSKGEGSRSGCLRNLSSNAEAIATIKYFRDKSLIDMKQWAYVAAKLRIMLEHEAQSRARVEDLLWPLLSDNEELIDWYRTEHLFYESLEDPERKYQVKTNEFYSYQIWRAMTGKWSELAQACEKALSTPDEFTQLRPRLVIFQFMLALARGDKQEMQTILLEKCTPKQRSKSYQYESGLTNNFIVSYATIFAKLAWRNGYELDLDTPWIPKDWLPVKSLEKYENPWPFMQAFDIWQPLKGEWAKWSPQNPRKP